MTHHDMDEFKKELDELEKRIDNIQVPGLAQVCPFCHTPLKENAYGKPESFCRVCESHLDWYKVFDANTMKFLHISKDFYY